MNKLGMSKKIVEFVGKNSQQPPIAHKISGQKRNILFCIRKCSGKNPENHNCIFWDDFYVTICPPLSLGTKTPRTP